MGDELIVPSLPVQSTSRTPVFLRYQHPNFAGDLQSRLKAFNLAEHFTRYPLLVKFDWLRPTFHVPVPEEWFLNWNNYPVYPVDTAIAGAHWAEMNDGRWVMSESEIDTDEWFVHPLVRRGSTRLNYFDKATTSHEDFSWQTLLHPRGTEFVPAFDYFYEWQLFRFADVVRRMRDAHPHFWKLGAHPHLLAYAAESSPADFDCDARMTKWDSRVAPFMWLAHYIAFRDTFSWYERGFVNEYKNALSARRTEITYRLRAAKKSGATQLLAWLGIGATDIERALKDCFLVQAQDWRWQDFHTTAKTMPLWRALQAQIGSVVEWLVLVTGNEPVHYLDKHRYSHMGQDVWAQLEDVLEYPLWKAARSASKLISQIGQRYVNGKFPRAKDFVISPVQLFEIGRHVNGFDSYVEAISRLLDESTHKDGDDPYRPRSRASWYRIIAITSDSFLRKAKGDEKPNGIKGLVNKLGANGDAWELQMKAIEKKKTNGERMTDISALIVNATDDDEMIIGFSLALYFTRHSTAHDNGLEFDWLNAEWAGPIFDSIVFFVPWALVELQKKHVVHKRDT